MFSIFFIRFQHINYTAEELFEIPNDTDECPWIEAKGIRKQKKQQQNE
jgi:hypothetical protein